MRLHYKIILFTIALIWVLGIFIEFFIPHFQSLIYVHPILNNFYSNVCHQNELKLVTSSNCSTLTCARCAGIYIGAFLSSATLLFIAIKKTPNIKYFIYALIPMCLDVLFYNLNIYQYSKTLAFATGILLGSVAFIYLYTGLQKFIVREKL